MGTFRAVVRAERPRPKRAWEGGKSQFQGKSVEAEEEA